MPFWTCKIICILKVLFLILPLAVCQLQFTSQQFPATLELSCNIIDLTATSFTFLDSLVISKTTINGPQVLASVSAHYSQGSHPVVSHVPDAQVSGEISTDGSNVRYLDMQWPLPQSGLDGNYTCTAYGVDSDFIPLQLLQTVTVKVKATGPLLTATPSVIRVGLTDNVDVTCSVPDPLALNVTRMASLEIHRIHNGAEQLLADITSNSGLKLHVGSDGASVNGSISDAGLSFLEVSWENPLQDHAGEYICEGTGVTSKGEPVFFDRRINVTWEEPDRQELVDRLHEMYIEKDKSDKLTAEQDKMLKEAYQTIVRLNRSSCPKTCDDLLLTPGDHVVNLAPDDGLGSITVLCHAEPSGEIWTVFQRRFDGSVDFYQNFTSYKAGFGSLDGEFWLGLDTIRRLIVQNGDDNQLRVDMTELSTNLNYTRIYPLFSIGDGEQYTLTVSGFNDQGWGMTHNSGSFFSTYDHGLTTIAARDFRCAGWWFSDSGYVNLNGVWGVTGKQSSMFWWEFRTNLNYVMEKTEMKFRKN